MKHPVNSQNFVASIMLIAGIVATIYLLFIFGNSVYRAQQKEALFQDFQQEIVALEKKSTELSERLAFQSTEQFLDKYAKANLGRVNPGEKVIILAPEDTGDELDFEGLSEAEIEQELLKRMPIRRQWWYFFFEA